jgi:hypothetical protein
MADRPPIVCLCGSARFAEELRAAERDLTLAGAVALVPWLPAAGADPLTDEQRAALGALHLARIDLADRVLVVDPGGYVGDAVRREIRHAHRTGKPVGYTDPPVVPGPGPGRVPGAGEARPA